MSLFQTYFQRAKSWIGRYTIPGGGISVSSCKQISYPEVTGYFIPTLLDWGMKDRALQYAHGLLRIQSEDGSWNEPRGRASYVFDPENDGLFRLVRENLMRPKDELVPTISIVLPVHNGSKYLRESIESCLMQTFRNWELIIVNDCSTDESGVIAEEYAVRDKRVRVIHNETNLKLPASLNVGFRYAKGEYLTWTSDDNRYLPNALQRMIDFLRDQPKYQMVCAAMKVIDGEGKLKKRRIFRPLRRHLLSGNTIGGCFLYHKSVLETVGGYDENCFLIEDYEYWLRIASHYAIGRINDVLYLYRVHTQNLSSTHNRIEIRKKHVEMCMKYWGKLSDTLSYRVRKRSIKKMISMAGLESDADALMAFASDECFTHPHDKTILRYVLFKYKLIHRLVQVSRCLSIFTKKVFTKKEKQT